MENLEQAATALTEVLVLRLNRVATKGELVLERDGGIPTRRTSSKESSPPVLMSCEGLACVREPTGEQVAMFVANEVVWEAQREEWMKEMEGVRKCIFRTFSIFNSSYFLPGFKFNSPFTCSNRIHFILTPIQLRELLRHTSGKQNTSPFWNKYKYK
jgi:hypothetical protein